MKIKYIQNIFPNKSLLFLIIFTGSFFYSYSQISGYQGKRFTIGYGSNIGYAVFSRNSSGKSVFTEKTSYDEPRSISDYFALNYKHQFNAEYLVKRDIALGFQYSFGKTQFKSLAGGELIKEITDQNNDITEIRVAEKQYTTMNIQTFGVYYKEYKNYSAPIGSYWGVKAAALLYSADFLEANNIPIEMMRKIKEHSYGTLLISYTKGTSRIYFNRLIVDSNIEFGFPFLMPNFKAMAKDDSYYSSNNGENINDLIKKRMNNRLWGNFFLNFNINLSLLAF